MPHRLANRPAPGLCGVHSDHASRARPVRQLRAHAPRDGRALRRRLRPHRPGPAQARRLLAGGRRLLRGRPAARGRPGRAGRHRPRRAHAGDRRPRARARRPPPAGRRRGPRLPAARDRLRAVPARHPARRRRRRRRRARHLPRRDAAHRAAARAPREPHALACRSRSTATRTSWRVDGRSDRDRRRGGEEHDVEVGAPRAVPRHAAGPAAARDDPAPRHADPARRRPGALGRAGRRRPARQPHARDGRLARAGERGARPRRPLRRRRGRRDRAHDQGARRDDAHPRPGRPARAHRPLGAARRPTSWPRSPSCPTWCPPSRPSSRR